MTRPKRNAHDASGQTSGNGKRPRHGHHPKSPYAERRPDFAALARRHPDFAKFATATATGAVRYELRSPEAQLALTTAILQDDFGLRWTLPDGHLCPAVPSRIDYLLWAADVSHFEATRGVAPRIADVGTGASCIYPLLGSRLLADSSWIAIDNDPAALASARDNVASNDLTGRIDVRDGSFLGAVAQDEDVCFTVCNPPFYGDLDAAGVHPERSRTGNRNQLVADGGELSFLKRLADTSVELPRVRWFTSLVGLKADVHPLELYVRELGASSVVRTTFQAARTARWAVAWTFGGPDGASVASCSESRATVRLRWRRRSLEDALTLVRGVVLHRDADSAHTAFGARGMGVEVFVTSAEPGCFDLELKLAGKRERAAGCVQSVADLLRVDLEEAVAPTNGDRSGSP